MMLYARRVYRPRETLAFVELWERWRDLTRREQYSVCRGRQSNKAVIRNLSALAHVFFHVYGLVYHLENEFAER
jgi:hypothetical protein